MFNILYHSLNVVINENCTVGEHKILQLLLPICSRNEHGLTFRMLIVASSVVVLSNDNRNKMTPKVLIRYVDHLNANVN